MFGKVAGRGVFRLCQRVFNMILVKLTKALRSSHCHTLKLYSEGVNGPLLERPQLQDEDLQARKY